VPYNSKFECFVSCYESNMLKKQQQIYQGVVDKKQ